jgi:hypothetical protein
MAQGMSGWQGTENLSGQACSKLVRSCSCKLSLKISNDVNQQCSDTT